MSALLKPSQAAEYLGLHPGTLANLRSRNGDGPPWCKLGSSVRYRIADLDAWALAHLVQPVAGR